MPPLGECKSRIQYYKPEPFEAEIEACLSRPPLLPAPQFWVTLSVSGATWASFLPCERPLYYSARYHTQTSSLFFLSVRLRPLSPPQFLLLLYTNIPGPDWMRRHTHTHSALELGRKLVYTVYCQRVEILLYCLYSGTYLHSKDNLYII